MTTDEFLIGVWIVGMPAIFGLARLLRPWLGIPLPIYILLWPLVLVAEVMFDGYRELWRRIWR